jgi:cell division protein FtsI (penicillin-binding protein 3)
MTKLSNPRARLLLLGGLFLFWIALIVVQLFRLQVLQCGVWIGRARRQQERTIDLPPARGVVYDRNGRELAMSQQADSIFAIPWEVPDHATAASLLANVLEVDPADLRQKLDSPKTFVWIARKVEPDAASRIHELNLKGVYFQQEPRRSYPNGSLAAQVLGYVGLDDVGLGGIELFYDETLRGSPGSMMFRQDARRKRLSRVEREPEAGQNLVLTIDRNIQFIAETELEAAMQETHAEAATIVVQDPHTGEILALANRPTFNPNGFAHVPPEALQNRAISDVYEPGSVFKVVTISSALEEKLTNPNEVIDCQNGSIVVGGMKIHDHEKLGLLSVAQVLARSSDVGAIKIGMRLGPARFDRYIRAYGFGSATGIELPGETRGLAKPVRKWSKVSIGAISMGQEIGVTPLQVTAMVSTIANNGVWSAPRLVSGITPPNSGPQSMVFRPTIQRRVISAATAAEMKTMMEGVVLSGTGRRAILDGYTSAGKTGTAQKLDPKTHRYSSTKYVGSFIGFAPAGNPAITIAVIIDSAVGLHQGGQVAAPVFQRVAQQVLEYLHVPHDAQLKNPQRLLLRAAVKDSDLEETSPDHVGETLPLAELAEPAGRNGTAPANADLRPAQAPGAAPASPAAAALPGSAVAGLRPATSQPAADTSLPEPALSSPNQPGLMPASGVVVDVDAALVPSLLGKSMRGAMEAAQQAGIVLEAHGTGVAREQLPAPGARIPRGGRVAVRFQR